MTPSPAPASAAAEPGSDTVGTLLHDLAHRLFEQRCTREVRHDAEAGHWPATLWQQVVHAGLTTAAVSESLGGAGASLADAGVIMRAAGRHAVPLPLVETLLGNWLLSQAGRPPADGPLTLSPLAAETGLTLHSDGEGERLRGGLRAVPWARVASQLLAVVTRGDGRQALLQLPLQDCRVSAALNVAAEPRDDVAFDDRPLGGICFELPAGCDHAARLLQLGAMARCQQMAGAMEWILERSLSYASERVQFGKPIGGFQAMQHLLAGMAEQVSAAVVAADTATGAIDGDDAEAAAGYAKARVGEAAGEVAAQAHQLHGAMGYSHEYPLHFLTRRLWAWRDEFGSERFWNQRAGRRLAGRGGARLWREIAR